MHFSCLLLSSHFHTWASPSRSLLVCSVQIDLSNNGLRAEGGKAIAEAIAVSPSLTLIE